MVYNHHVDKGFAQRVAEASAQKEERVHIFTQVSGADSYAQKYCITHDCAQKESTPEISTLLLLEIDAEAFAHLSMPLEDEQIHLSAQMPPIIFPTDVGDISTQKGSGIKPVIIDERTQDRLDDFYASHPDIDLNPVINGRINDMLDEAERAESG